MLALFSDFGDNAQSLLYDHFFATGDYIIYIMVGNTSNQN